MNQGEGQNELILKAAFDMVITSSSSEAVRGLAPVRSSSSRPAKTPRVFVAEGRWARLVLE